MTFFNRYAALILSCSVILMANTVAAETITPDIIRLIQETSRPANEFCELDEKEELLRDLLDEEESNNLKSSDFPVLLVDDLAEGEEDCVNNYGLTTALKYSSTHRAAFHYALNISGDYLEVEDKSVWQVHSWDKTKINSWNLSDTIVIAPNKNIFTRWKYPYKLINLETLDVAKARMKLNPVFNDPNIDIYVHWVINVDYNYGYVRLEDGSLWKINKNDKSSLKSFTPYSIVIIGTNDGWFRTSNPNILISVKNNKYIRGMVVN